MPQINWLAVIVAAVVMFGLGAVWYSPVVAGMIYDRYKVGRVHPVYWIGVVVMAIALLRIPFGETPVWHGIGEALLAPFI